MGADTDYFHWEEDHRAFLKTLSGKKVFMCFSGGKDSSLAMDYLLRAGDRFDFNFEAHAGAFPIHRYLESERKRIGSYWKGRGIDIIWHEFSEDDEQMRSAENPCLLCQKIRKKVLQKLVTREEDLSKLVMVVSYSLWDLVGYSIEHILDDIFTNAVEKEDGEKSKRFTETSQRFYPLLKMNEGYTIFRPLLKLNSNSIIDSLDKIGIPILSIPCEFKDYRPKRILEKYYEKMGLSFDYDSVFRFAKESLELPDISDFTSIDKDEYLSDIF
ncbi:hypothetical protein ACFL1Z_00595 [Thermodesulfobacteriota bacterium]